MRSRAVAVVVVALASAGCTAGSAGITSSDARPIPATTTATTTTTAARPTTTTDTSTTASTTSTTTTTTPTVPEVPIADDPDVRQFVLDNGLTVYLRHNERPGFHADLRLVINAGSAFEEPDQAGVAHFLEHMLFNGTEEFPHNDLVATLRKFGMELGPDINAYTSFDETVYSLSVPLSDRANLPTALDVVSQWLTAATLSADEVTKERGVVLDEWRVRDQSLDGRIGGAVDDLFLTGSAYEGREPIGNEAAIQAMTPELLRRFYDRWYRPDNAAVIVVGDIDVGAVEDAVRSRMEGAQPRGGDGPRAISELAPFTTAAARVLRDPDQLDAGVEVTLPLPARQGAETDVSVRDTELLDLAMSMIATRLGDDIAHGTSAFTSSFVSNNDVVRAIDAPSVVLRSRPDDSNDAAIALLLELERARRFGFDANELARAVARDRAGVESAYSARDTRQDERLADDLVDHFLTGASIPSADDAHDLYTSILDDATPAAVAAVFAARLAAATPHVLVIAPDTASAVPTPDDLVLDVDGLGALALNPRPPSDPAPDELMPRPEPVAEAQRLDLTNDPFSFLDPLELVFPNGARVVVNPTDIVDGKLAFAATSPGGLSLVADADVPEALVTTRVVEASGVGDLDPVELDTLLGSSTVDLHPYLDQAEEGFYGSSDTGDLEQLFQLVHLYLESPRFDQHGMQTSLEFLREYADDPGRDPDFATYLAYTHARFGGDERFAPIPTADQFAGLDLPTVEKVWRERFSNAADWTFAISGDFDPIDAIDLARRYVGTLTGTAATEQFVDLQPDAPAQVVQRTVTAGTGDTSTLSLFYTVASLSPAHDAVLCDVLADVLTNRLTDHVREALGASYSPSAYCYTQHEPDPLVNTVLQITGDPATIDELSTIVQQDLAMVRGAGPTNAELEAALADLRDRYSLFSNEAILAVLVRAPAHPEELQAFIDRAGALEDVKAAAVQAFASAVLPAGAYIEIRTVPA